MWSAARLTHADPLTREEDPPGVLFCLDSLPRRRIPPRLSGTFRDIIGEGGEERMKGSSDLPCD